MLQVSWHGGWQKNEIEKEGEKKLKKGVKQKQ